MNEKFVLEAITIELAHLKAGSPRFNNWRPRWAEDYLASSDDHLEHRPIYVFASENEEGKPVLVRLCLLEESQKLRIVTSVMGRASEDSEESRCIVQYTNQDLTQIARQVLYATKKADQIGVEQDGCLGGMPKAPQSRG